MTSVEKINHRNTVIVHNNYHDWDEKINGSTFVGVPDENNNRIIKIGVALCSEKDRFCKKTGRELAAKRIDEGKYFIYFTPFDIEKQRKDYFKDVKRHMYATDLVYKYKKIFANPKGHEESDNG